MGASCLSPSWSSLAPDERKYCVLVGMPLGVYTVANQEWALDFVQDAVASDRSIRVLIVFEAYTRESLAIEVDTNFVDLRATQVLDRIIAERGLPCEWHRSAAHRPGGHGSRQSFIPNKCREKFASLSMR